MLFSLRMPLDATTLQMALIGYKAEREKIEQKIAELEQQLGGRTARTVNPVAATTKKRRPRHMSAAARKRIADAQRKRWAEYRKKKAA